MVVRQWVLTLADPDRLFNRKPAEDVEIEPDAEPEATVESDGLQAPAAH